MQLHDIFPAIDTTWYLVKFGSIAVGMSLLFFYILWRWQQRKKKKARPYYLKILYKCDLNNSKRTANQLGYYGKFVVRTPQEKETLQSLLTTLTPYKYHQKSVPLPSEIQKEIQTFFTQLGFKDV